MEVLKENTKSICPICYAEVNARVVARNEGVYLIKECPKDGGFDILIEKDIEFYKKVMNKALLKQRIPFANLTISLTHLCNLSCSICYLPKRENYSFPLEDMKKIILSFNHKWIRLSGGEPTLREDLPQIIEEIAKNGKNPLLFTNGIRLTNIGYIKKLKNAGLKMINVSFNGFDDKVYERIDGKKLLGTKLKALRNIKRMKIPTVLSVMLVKGVNENELRKIYHYCLNNNSFIQQFRIRSAVQIGRHTQEECFYLSEIVKIVSKLIGISEEKLISHSLNKGMPYSQYNRNPMPCHLQIDLFSLLMDEVGIDKMGNSLIKKIQAIFKLLPKVGLKNLIRMFLRKLANKERLLELVIHLRSFPDKYRIDLGEIQRCPSAYLTCADKRLLPFCYALILNEKSDIL
ncbi:radical SAM protein [bacterium]|nr:radical SAM protein [bacterium]